MAEERLNGAQIGAVHKQVGGELMAELMRCDMVGDAGFARVKVHQPLDRAGNYSTEYFRDFCLP